MGVGDVPALPVPLNSDVRAEPFHCICAEHSPSGRPPGIPGHEFYVHI